ncbi:MAG: Cof-type HAD-IIB family hydrolase [Clostridia bacterium]|nr:Cof-type HAD-IIB family hydrolase [Clostridia bacterium]
MKYKLLFSDLDGTLLNSRIEVSEENRLAIRKMTEMGVIFVPSSGRTLYEMPQCVRENPDIRYISYSDGAVVLDRLTGERLCACLDRTLSHLVLDMLAEYDTLLTVRNGGRSYVDESKNSLADHEHYRLNDLYSNFIYATNNPVGDYDRFVHSLDEIEMICVFFSNEDELEECRRRINAHPELTCTPSAPHNLEIFHSRAGKGNALLRLADHLGIPREQTIAVGDSSNDLSMIEAAGLGLAMGNAWPDLLALADAQICHHDDHGMKYILDHYLTEKG